MPKFLNLNKKKKLSEAHRKNTAHVSQPTDGHSLQVAQLSREEEGAIQESLVSVSEVEELNSIDLQTVKDASVKIKTIQKQGYALIGEQVSRVRDALKKYSKGDRSFNSWVKVLFTSRQTAYNYIAYHELYSSFSRNKKLQKKIEEMPAKAVYELAAVNGTQEKKKEVLLAYKGEGAKDTLSLIRSSFPKEGDKKQDREVLERSCTKRIKKDLLDLKKLRRVSGETYGQILKLKELIEEVLDKHSQ